MVVWDAIGTPVYNPKLNLEVLMTVYNNIIGIDIGKNNFVTTVHGSKNVKAYGNTTEGIGEFISDHQKILPEALCILEATGGYELQLLYTLCTNGNSVHRANALKVKNFIRSYGNSAKTDKLDAIALAKYGLERSDSLEPFVPQSKAALELFQLAQRRLDLKQILIAEKNRAHTPNKPSKLVQESYKEMIEVVSKQMKEIMDRAQQLIEKEPELKGRLEVLKTIPGIGDIVSFELAILLPELGKLNRREIASLAGLAPRANDSGNHRGYRRVCPGRRQIKSSLYMSAMTAVRSNSKFRFKEYYEGLLNRGKKKKVALTALMRKILVIANAKLKESYS